MSALTIPDSSLLTQPPIVRLQYFKDFAVAHTLLVETKDRLLEAITESAANSLIIVSGPTGVGKTTLLAKIRQRQGTGRRNTGSRVVAGGKHGGYPTRVSPL